MKFLKLRLFDGNGALAAVRIDRISHLEEVYYSITRDAAPQFRHTFVYFQVGDSVVDIQVEETIEQIGRKLRRALIEGAK